MGKISFVISIVVMVVLLVFPLGWYGFGIALVTGVIALLIGLRSKKQGFAAVSLFIMLFLAVFLYFKQIRIDNIERVLYLDTLTTQKVSSAEQVVKNMKAINLDGCPFNFKIAYLNHIGAWQERCDLEDAVQIYLDRFQSGRAAFEGFIRGLVFDFSMIDEEYQASQQLIKMDQQATKKISDTFDVVNNIALEYGAKLPE